MTTGSILLAIALFIVLLLYLLRPFLKLSSTDEPATPQQKLLAQKEQLLDQIRALDFDHTTGKIHKSTYQEQRHILIHKAALVLQQLDRQIPDSTDIETAIERAIAQLRQTSSNGQGNSCPHCGQPADLGDKFCSVCGHQLVEAIG